MCLLLTILLSSPSLHPPLIRAQVAPGQHELSPIFSLTNVAADQNMIARRVMEDVAAKHGLAVLFHEKPFQVLCAVPTGL